MAELIKANLYTQKFQSF